MSDEDRITRVVEELKGDFSGASRVLGVRADATSLGDIARITFLDETAQQVYGDWTECARGNVAYQQMEAGRYPNDQRLADLVGELSAKSDDFRRWWAESPVQDKTTGTKYFHHPVAGDLELGYETLRAADDPDQALITHAAEPGSPSYDALQMLLSRGAQAPRPASHFGLADRGVRRSRRSFRPGQIVLKARRYTVPRTRFRDIFVTSSENFLWRKSLWSAVVASQRRLLTKFLVGGLEMKAGDLTNHRPPAS